MATASLSIPSRPMPWRLLLAVVGIVLAAIMLFSFTVGFSSSSAAKPSTVTNTHVVSTPDSLDRGKVTPSTAAGSPDSLDRGNVTPSSDYGPTRCPVNQPC